jgi:hypothetical protein
MPNVSMIQPRRKDMTSVLGSSAGVRQWKRSLRAPALAAAFLGTAASAAAGERGCPPNPPSGNPPATRTLTSDFALAVESASGASGDVVGVTVTLTSRLPSPNGFMSLITICHDPAVAEIEGDPIYSEDFLRLLDAMGVNFLPVEEGTEQPYHQKGHGFVQIAGLGGRRGAAYSARFPSDEPLAVMTVYYRLKGAPGATSPLTFCDAVLERGNVFCNYNLLYHSIEDSQSDFKSYEYVPAVKEDGLLAVVEGPVTRPARPPEPPRAKVYPARLTPDEVNFRVRIPGASALPGAREVPIDVYVTADVEYSSIQVPIEFDERYLRLVRAENYFISGVVLENNAGDVATEFGHEGYAVIWSGSGISSRRLAEEGVEIRAATLYFDVLDEAAGIASTRLEVERVVDYRGVPYPPFVGVHYAQGQPGEAVVREEISPFEISNGVLHIVGDVSYFIRGDANGDFAVNISDPIDTLNFLFLGARSPACLDAADANDDGRVQISDAINTLDALFQGKGPLPPPAGEPGADPTPDDLTCRRAGSP